MMLINRKQLAFTVAGAAAGLTANSDLPVASAQTDGVYVVVEKQGTPSGGNAPQQLLVPPDYILGVTASGSSSWREVDLSSSVSQQTASNITFSAGGDIVASTVQAAIEEVDTEKLAKAGGTLTGQLLVGTAGSLVLKVQLMMLTKQLLLQLILMPPELSRCQMKVER